MPASQCLSDSTEWFLRFVCDSLKNVSYTSYRECRYPMRKCVNNNFVTFLMFWFYRFFSFCHIYSFYSQQNEMLHSMPFCAARWHMPDIHHLRSYLFLSILMLCFYQGGNSYRSTGKIDCSTFVARAWILTDKLLASNVPSQLLCIAGVTQYCATNKMYTEVPSQILWESEVNARRKVDLATKCVNSSWSKCNYYHYIRVCYVCWCNAWLSATPFTHFGVIAGWHNAVSPAIAIIYGIGTSKLLNILWTRGLIGQ